MFIASSTLVYNQKCKELSFGICGYPVYRKNKLVIRVILQADFTAYYDEAQVGDQNDCRMPPKTILR